MHNLTDDSPMSNTISADTDFRINHRHVELVAPFVLLCATDGCFAYVRSPMHFEHLLLSTLQGAEDVDAWRDGFLAAVSAIAGDDAAIGLLGVGADFAGFKELFRERAAEVERRYVGPLDKLEGQVAKAEQKLEELRRRRVALTAELWQEYKPGYERYLEAAPAAAGEEAS